MSVEEIFDADLTEGEIRVTVERYGARRSGVRHSNPDPAWWAEIVRQTLEIPVGEWSNSSVRHRLDGDPS